MTRAAAHATGPEPVRPSVPDIIRFPRLEWGFAGQELALLATGPLPPEFAIHRLIVRQRISITRCRKLLNLPTTVRLAYSS